MCPRFGVEEDENLIIPLSTNIKFRQKPAVPTQETRKGNLARQNPAAQARHHGKTMIFLLTPAKANGECQRSAEQAAMLSEGKPGAVMRRLLLQH